MPRVLTIHRVTVPSTGRAAYMERLRAKESHYTGMGCRFWVFEEDALPGAFVEFCEAESHATLSAAHAAASDADHGAERVYTQLELS